MTPKEFITEILRQHPELSEQQIQELLATERTRTNGLLSDETLLRLIAAKYGVQVQQISIQNSGILSTNRLCSGLNDVTVKGHLVAVFPTKTFQGAEKSGKFATLMLADNEGILRVVLWDDKTDLIEKGELKPGKIVRLLHGYTKDDRYGKTELHLGRKSQIEVEQKLNAQPLSIERFATKISTINKSSGNVHVSGVVKTVLGRSTFTRNDNSDGTVMRLMLADDSGEALVVVWNEKAFELENLKANTRLLLINARVKEGQNGGLEVHVDSNTYINTE
jgi:replication factor A1